MYKMDYKFKTTEFMTENEKKQVLRDWKKFLNALIEDYSKLNLDWNAYNTFTDRLYNHLHLHCGYIAHFSRDGFFSRYFTGPTSLKEFFEHWDRTDVLSPIHPAEEYEDINTAMHTEYLKIKDKLFKIIENVERKQDIEQAKILLKKWDIKPEELM